MSIAQESHVPEGMTALKTSLHRVPEGHPKLARRFIAGLSDTKTLRPVGTVEMDAISCHRSSVPLGRADFRPESGDKSPGYSQSSLRDVRTNAGHFNSTKAL